MQWQQRDRRASSGSRGRDKVRAADLARAHDLQVVDEEDGDTTIRKIASALSIPAALLLEPEPVNPGDVSLSRAARLSSAIRQVMWSEVPMRYASPLEPVPDDIASLSPDEFFADMPAIDARRR